MTYHDMTTPDYMHDNPQLFEGKSKHPTPTLLSSLRPFVLFIFPYPTRARVMLKYQDLLKTHHDELAEILAKETGKTFEDAKGDVWRGIEVVEHAANISSLMMGETVENVATKIDTYSYTQPLGVCAGITPFNFPAMVPFWFLPYAIATGNTLLSFNMSCTS